MFNIQNLRLYYVKICGKRLFHDLVNNCPSLEIVKTWNHKGHCILLLFYLFSFQKEAVLKFLKIPSEPATIDFCFSCRAQTFHACRNWVLSFESWTSYLRVCNSLLFADIAQGQGKQIVSVWLGVKKNISPGRPQKIFFHIFFVT